MGAAELTRETASGAAVSFAEWGLGPVCIVPGRYTVYTWIIPRGKGFVNSRVQLSLGIVHQPFSSTKERGCAGMKSRANASGAVQVSLAIGVMLLLALVLRQVLPTTNLVPYVVVSLISILAYIVKSRFQ